MAYGMPGWLVYHGVTHPLELPSDVVARLPTIHKHLTFGDKVLVGAVRVLPSTFALSPQGAAPVTPDFVTPVEVASINLSKPTKKPARSAWMPAESDDGW